MKPLKKKEKQKENTMAPNMEEMKKLGKEMDQNRTSKELKEKDWVPDPKQEE